MKRLTWPLILLNLLMFIWVGNAFSYTINDTTDVVSYYAGSGSRYLWDGSYEHDVIGDPPIFDVWGINLIYSSGNLTLDLFTNFDSDGYYKIPGWDIYSFIADVAIDVNPGDNDGYEYGVVMRDHQTWTVGADPGNDYTIGLYEVDSWHASSHFYNSTYNPYAIFGGGYMVGEDEHIPHVAIAGGSLVAGVTASTIDVDYDFGDLPDGPDGEVISPVSLGGDGYSAPKFKWSFTINDISTTLGIGVGDDIDLLWGGASCSNDAIAGRATVIPEPATLVLTGFGLIGLVVMWRSKSRRRFRRK